MAKDKRWLLLLICIWVTLFIMLPIGTMVLYSLWEVRDFRVQPSFTLSNYATVFHDPIYLALFWKTVRLSCFVALLSTIISFFLALYVIGRGARYKTILYLSVLAPLWVGYLIRIYSWRTILGEQGFINSFLMMVGILKEPSTLFLFNNTAVVITMLCISIPFTFIPIYSVLEKIPASLLLAASDLGANDRKRFVTVTLPLSLPGIVTGFTFAFITAFGDYMAPSLVGGTNGIMIGNVIQTQFGGSFNWPLGAALAVIMLLFILSVMALTRRFTDVKGVFEEN
ncbi:UNVERIFIED_CONTAM: spermidine/putrescine transport system permease protein [Brevibacillus sp. OAP136]